MSRLRVVKARYGSAETGADVTKTVRRLVVDGRLIFGVGNGPLGGDPAPNELKVLDIEWRVGFKRFRGEFAEGIQVDLP